MKNIEQFNFVAAMLLATLYAQFPKRIQLNTVELTNAQKGVGEWEWSVSRSYQNVFADTLQFLLDEGFVRASGQGAQGTVFAQTVLTMKGLAVLNSVPESVSDKKSFGEQLGELSQRVENVKTIGGVLQSILNLFASY